MWLVDVDVEDAAVWRDLFGDLDYLWDASSGAFSLSGLFGRGVLLCRRGALRGGLGAPGGRTLGGSGVARDGSAAASGSWLQFSCDGFIWSSLGCLIVKYTWRTRFSFCWWRAVLYFWFIWFCCCWKYIVHFFSIESRTEFRLPLVNDLGFLWFRLRLRDLFASQLRLGSGSLHLNFVASTSLLYILHCYSHVSHLIVRWRRRSALLLTPSSSSNPCLSLLSLDKVLRFWFQFRYQINFIVHGWIRRLQFNESSLVIIGVKLQQVVVRFRPRHVEVIVVGARLLVVLLFFWALQQLMALLLFNNVSIEIRAQSTGAFIDIPLNWQQIWDEVRRWVKDYVIFIVRHDFLPSAFQLHDGLLRRWRMLKHLQLLKLPL